MRGGSGFPIWPCSRWGLPCRRVLPPTRCALTAPFTLAGPARDWGGLLSVALSVGSRPPGVTWHPIRRSPDFPPLPPSLAEAATARPTLASHDTGPRAEVKCPGAGADG